MTLGSSPRPPEQATNWGVVLAIVIVVAPTLFSLQSNLSLPGPLRVNGAKAVEAAALGLFVLWMIRERWMPWLNLLMVLAIVFVSYSGLSGLWAVDQTGFVQQYKKLIHVFANVVTLFIAIRTRRDLEHAMLGFKMVAFGVAASTFLEVTMPAFRVAAAMQGEESAVRMASDVGVGSYYRANGPMGHPNWLGFWLGMTIVLSPYFWVRYPSRGARLFIVITTLLELYGLVKAHVRLGLMGLGVGTMWLIVRGAFPHRAMALSAIAFGSVLAWPFLPESWKARTFSSEHLEESNSIKARMSLLTEGLRLGIEHGGIGQGWGCFGYVFYEEATGFAVEKFLTDENVLWRQDETRVDNLGGHNAYFEVLVELGIPGLVLFLAIGVVAFLGLFGATHRHARDPPARMMGLTLEASLVSMAAMNVVMHAQEQRVVWVWLGITASYLSLTRYGLMDEPGDSTFPRAAKWPVVILGALVGLLVLAASAV